MRGHFIGDGQRPAISGRTFPVYAPETGAIVGHAPRGDAADVEVAVAAARDAFPRWCAMAPAEREACFLRAADLIEAQRDHLVDLVIDESGSI